MESTAEQIELVRQAKARGERRVSVSFTPEQRKASREIVDQELAGKEENIAHFRKIKAAAEQPGFFGDIRRSISLSRLSVGESYRARLASNREFCPIFVPVMRNFQRWSSTV